MNSLARRAARLALLLFACGCTADAVFVIDVTAPNGLNGQEGSIQRLEVILTNEGEEDDLFFPEAGPQAIPLPTDFSFSIPRGRQGTVETHVEALDADGNIIGEGTSQAAVEAGQRTRFTVELSAP